MTASAVHMAAGPGRKARALGPHASLGSPGWLHRWRKAVAPAPMPPGTTWWAPKANEASWPARSVATPSPMTNPTTTRNDQERAVERGLGLGLVHGDARFMVWDWSRRTRAGWGSGDVIRQMTSAVTDGPGSGEPEEGCGAIVDRLGRKGMIVARVSASSDRLGRRHQATAD